MGFLPYKERYFLLSGKKISVWFSSVPFFFFMQREGKKIINAAVHKEDV